MNFKIINCLFLSEIFVVILVVKICFNSVISSEIQIDNLNFENENIENGFKNLNWNNDVRNNGNSEILSRKRRYLTFPSGSSFQLVYDLIIGVVDYTNYLILGVTVALAWQLPSDAPSEIVEHLKEKLNDGTLGVSRNDTIENIQYVDTKPKQTQKQPQISSYSSPYILKSPISSHYTSSHFHPPMHSKYYTSSPIYYPKLNYPHSNNVISKKHDTNYYSIPRNPFGEWKNSKITKISPSSFAPSASSNTSSKWSQWWKNGKRTYSHRKPVYARNHRVYPVFAKRTTDQHNRQKRHGIEGPSLTKIDEIHLRYHRSTRQDLYGKIEKYLESHNKNGHQCVLKALCETGQKGNEVEPGTFVGEIMRSIFTIPESEDPVNSYKHQLYDEAHAHAGSCVDRYPLCPESLWKADFIF